MGEPSAASTREQFSQRVLEKARTKPAWCSSIRWQIELRRRKSGVDRGKRTDLEDNQYGKEK